MKLNRQIAMALVTAFFVPMIIIVLVYFMFSMREIKKINNRYNIEMEISDIFSGPSHTLVDMCTEEAKQNLTRSAVFSPMDFNSVTYRKEQNAILEEHESYWILIKGEDNVLFFGKNMESDISEENKSEMEELANKKLKENAESGVVEDGENSDGHASEAAEEGTGTGSEEAVEETESPEEAAQRKVRERKKVILQNEWVELTKDSTTPLESHWDEAHKSYWQSFAIKFQDGLEGRIVIVTEAEELNAEWHNIMIQLVLTAFLTIFATILLVASMIYRSVYMPIIKLREASKSIMAGDLDFTIDFSSTRDEIGDLGRDFEQMRLKLQESQEKALRDENGTRELISNISHDLKTPITSIKGYVEGIMDGVADTPEKMNRYLRTIYTKANDMTRLIDELTFYSKADRNQIPYTFSKIDIIAYLLDLAEEMDDSLTAENIRFEFECECEGPIFIVADGEQLKKVLNNIISNSVKYMDKEEKRIKIHISENDMYVRLDIADNGKGIDEDDLKHIFDRFYRTDSARNSSTGGSGIGLSIVKKIIQDHEGRIMAFSRVGEGTTMRIFLKKHKEEFGR